MKKVLIITASLRVNSNSDILANEFAKGAEEAGNEVELISLKDKNIQFCRGCLACQVNHKCVINDDVSYVMEKVKKSDVLVFATPIYYYEMSGLLKTLLDRLNPLYGSDYNFREVYMIATAADDGQTTFDRAINGLSGWIECFSGVELRKIVKGGGINNPLEALNNKKALNDAFNLGKEI